MVGIGSVGVVGGGGETDGGVEEEGEDVVAIS